MPVKQHATFILGVVVVFLFLLSLVFLKSALNHTPTTEEGGYFATTVDPLITRQITDEDLLPADTPLITFIDPQRGSENPSVFFVEFSDFACPFCKEMQEVIQRILLQYPEEVRHVWKDAPHTGDFLNSMNAHLAARCAEQQQKFWEFHDALFETQTNFSLTVFQTIAGDLNLDLSAWNTCFQEEEERAKIERGLVEAEALAIDTTPYFFVNDRRISGAITFEELNRIILQEITNKVLISENEVIN